MIKSNKFHQSLQEIMRNMVTFLCYFIIRTSLGKCRVITKSTVNKVNECDKQKLDF